ncbi:Uncharacterized conserved protein [Tranquillimonas rosea]|uniref:Uncharacterized conserved protein n=1 Tax=Tranquillimonas rosea TaxID=641238 RepID=A0A1H9QWR7_9RHOB|nr:exopolysaccharide biosynthesis protein [Tranquillimonas rosea]SER64870.1 Uncharacterized conserved protein [Tranquillimonas rosea]
MSSNGTIQDILGAMRSLAGRQDKVSVGDVVETVGEKGYGPFIFIPALIEITPLGGIPGLPTLLAVLVILFAGQVAIGRRSMWLPGPLWRLSTNGERVGTAADKLMPVARRIDRWFPGRFPQLTTATMRWLASVMCVALCVTVPPLELVPFASTAPMAAIAAFGLAITLRDGALMMLGYLLVVVAAGVVGYAVTSAM